MGEGAQHLPLVSATSELAAQTVVYQINPGCVVRRHPVTYADFVYNWQRNQAVPFHRRRRKALYAGRRSRLRRYRQGHRQPRRPLRGDGDFFVALSGLALAFFLPGARHVAQAIASAPVSRTPLSTFCLGRPYLVSQLHPATRWNWSAMPATGPAGHLASITYYFTSTLTEMLNALSGHELDVATVPGTSSPISNCRPQGDFPVLAWRAPVTRTSSSTRRRLRCRARSCARAVMMASTVRPWSPMCSRLSG